MYTTNQRHFDGSPLRQYAQQKSVNPDSRHWEKLAGDRLRAARAVCGKPEMAKAADMLSPDWFERRTWQQLAEAWQRVLDAPQPLDAVAICRLLDDAPADTSIPF